jgi:hypothetical protein
MPRKPGSRARDYSIEPSTNRYGPKHVDPHSPWQLLIESTRAEKQIPVRALATRAQIPPGTLFNWLRSGTGAPSRTTYTTSVNARLSRALGISEDSLADAYNQSAFRPVDPTIADPEPRPAPHLAENATAFTVDGLRRFLHNLKATGRKSFTIEELELAASMILGEVKPLDGKE